MAALPYMQLYVADYLADTAHLTTEEHGAYLLLLFSYWQTGKPLRADRLASVARMSNERWTDVEVSLKEFFEIDGNSWIHHRVERDLDAVMSKRKGCSEAGKASAAARKAAKDARSREAGNGRSTDVDESLQRNVNHTDTDTDTEKNSCHQQAADRGYKFRFSEIQDAYNRICSPTLPACRVASDARKKQAQKLINLEFSGTHPFREHGLPFLESFFRDCLGNPHWVGQNDRNWKADFDFVTNPKNAIKLLERICG